MTWTCPICKREYKSPSQFHSCYSRDLEEHIETKPVFIQEIVMGLLEYCESLGEHEVRSLKTSIVLRNKANFLSIMPRTKNVGLEFQLPYETDEEQIIKSVRISSKRLYYQARIHSIEEFNDDVRQWIKDSYELISGKK
jgi:uncharacterized protein DUF5655